jgi:hypothetical protein
MKYGLILGGLLVYLSACQQGPDLRSFDTGGWQRDTLGCAGVRLEQLASLMDQQQELMGWSEQTITTYLGEPDYREIYVRNQKFLIYFLEPTLECGADGKDNPLRLYLRFDALGDSRELTLRNQ